MADDAVDVPEGPDPLADLRTRLQRVYADAPADHAVDRIFADVVAEYAIPRALPEALLEGFAWDLEGRRYRSLEDLGAYAVRVAGCVGVMMACVMRARAPALLARACDLGVAMQLTNIARDVGADARMGRLYLPLDWMEEYGIEPQRWLRAPRFTPELGRVIERLLGAADVLYGRAGAGIEQLPSDCRRGIRAARLLYAEIGRAVRRRGFDSVSGRAVVGPARKALHLARASIAPRNALPLGGEGLAATEWLVRAVSAQATRASDADAGVLESPLEWVVHQFERLQERERRALLEPDVH